MFKEAIDTYRGRIDKDIDEFLRKKKRSRDLGKLVSSIYGNIHEFIMRGGKRLRPIALIFSYKGSGKKESKELISASSSVEYMHNATLLHDDVMDRGIKRRGKPTYHLLFRDWFKKNYGEGDSVLFGDSMSVLGGNILVSMGLEKLLETDFDCELLKEASEEYLNTYEKLSDGQIMDISFNYKNSVSEKEYMEMIERKTAVLFKLSVDIGQILAESDKTQRKYLGSFALNSALAFQIQDDLIDLEPFEISGKNQGIDLKEGKKTLAVIRAMESGDKKETSAIRSVLGNKKAKKSEIRAAISAIESSGALSYCRNKALGLILDSKKYLEKSSLAPESEQFFTEFADYLVNRKY